MQATVLSLLSSQGQAVTLTYHADGVYIPATGIVTSNDTVVVTTGVLLPLSRGLKYMPGTDISIDDQQLLLPGNIAQPTVGTTATINGKNYLVTEVTPLNPAGTALIYDCMIRGAPGPAANPTVLLPLAISDFQNGAYSTVGAAASLHDQWVPDPINWLPWDDGYIIPGVGVVFDTIHFAGMLASPGLLAALPTDFTCVAEYSKLGPDGHFSLTAATGLDFGVERQWDDDLGYGTSFIGSFAGGGATTDSINVASTSGDMKIALLFSNSVMGFSIDGAAALSGPTNTDVTPLGVLGFLLGAGYPDTHTGGVTLKKLTFYPAVDPQQLPGLSA